MPIVVFHGTINPSSFFSDLCLNGQSQAVLRTGPQKNFCVDEIHGSTRIGNG
jgi:hypothetical protein